MKTEKILSLLLAVSVLANVGLFVANNPFGQARISDLIEKTQALSAENMALQKQAEANNLSMQATLTQLSFYRAHLSSEEEAAEGVPVANTVFASMEAPAVSQRVEYVRTGPYLTRNVITNGSIMNISVEIRPGRGRILVDTRPLMGIVFQDAANTAAYVAANTTGIDLSANDILYSIEADKQISSVDGPSAGALMTLVTIAALQNRPIDDSVTLTGTIGADGHIGAIGGAVEKAAAARQSGLTTFLLPLDNQALTIYNPRSVDYGGFQIIEQVPSTVSAKEYIEKNVGINVTYVNTIENVVTASLK